MRNLKIAQEGPGENRARLACIARAPLRKALLHLVQRQTPSQNDKTN